MSWALTGDGRAMPSPFPFASMTLIVTVLSSALTAGGLYPVALNISGIRSLLSDLLGPSLAEIPARHTPNLFGGAP